MSHVSVQGMSVCVCSLKLLEFTSKGASQQAETEETSLGCRSRWRNRSDLVHLSVSSTGDLKLTVTDEKHLLGNLDVNWCFVITVTRRCVCEEIPILCVRGCCGGKCSFCVFKLSQRHKAVAGQNEAADGHWRFVTDRFHAAASRCWSFWNVCLFYRHDFSVSAAGRWISR